MGREHGKKAGLIFFTRFGIAGKDLDYRVVNYTLDQQESHLEANSFCSVSRNSD